MNGLSFATPWLGAAALIGLPVILAIHFLQLPSRPRTVSTLFLLETVRPESAGGRRFRRLRQSVPLWLQLLAVCLIAWLLAGPRWLRPDASQTVVILLDSSVSMRAFREKLAASLPERLATLERATASTRWQLLESDPAAARLYAGSSREELQSALGRWEPRLGTHDPDPALRRALALVREEQGVVLFVTDHPATVPPGVALWAIGEPIENSGFAGFTATAQGWEALVRHYGGQPRTLRWRIEPGGEWEALTLKPGEVLTLRGPYPGGRATLALDPADRFPLDDRLPFVRPEPGRLRVRVSGEAAALPANARWLEALLRSLPAMERVTQEPVHLTIAFYDPLLPRLPEGPAIILLHEPAPPPEARLLRGPVIAERDPLLSGLSWDGLLTGEGFGIPATAQDRPLLWQGERRLIFRRGRQLFIGFDPVQSNATRLPAFVVLLHRFVDSVRAATPLPETANFETHQPLSPAPRHAPPRWSLAAEGAPPLETRFPRAPSQPGFFTLGDHGEALLTGAAHFADLREADFRKAASADPLPEIAARQRERHSEADGLTPLWLLLLGGVLVANWSWKS